MEYLIFKTDIATKKKVEALKPIFNKHPVITHWSIDITDIDHVLRIKASGNISEDDIINLVKTSGFYCDVLPD